MLAITPGIWSQFWTPHDQTVIEGLECVQGRALELEKGLMRDLISLHLRSDAVGMQHALAPAPSLGQVNPAGTETGTVCCWLRAGSSFQTLCPSTGCSSQLPPVQQVLTGSQGIITQQQ